MNDSVWATVSGFAQNYHCSVERVLDMSWQNIYLYVSVLPSYESYEDKKKGKRINADDPKNQSEINRILGI